MKTAQPGELVPVAQFEIRLFENGETKLCQIWVNPVTMVAEWRPVPMIEVKEDKRPCTAGYLDDEDD